MQISIIWNNFSCTQVFLGNCSLFVKWDMDGPTCCMWNVQTSIRPITNSWDQNGVMSPSPITAAAEYTRKLILLLSNSIASLLYDGHNLWNGLQQEGNVFINVGLSLKFCIWRLKQRNIFSSSVHTPFDVRFPEYMCLNVSMWISVSSVTPNKNQVEFRWNTVSGIWR